MDRRIQMIIVCLILILLSLSTIVYGVFVRLWSTSVNVTITATSFKKSLLIYTRPYVPIANLSINYELVYQISGENVYRISEIQLRLVGFTGYYRVFIRDSSKNIMWSTSGFCRTGFIKNLTPEAILNARDSYEIGISIKGVDCITALVKPLLKFTDWYRKAAETMSKSNLLLWLILKCVNKLADMLKPEDVNLWEAAPIAVARSSIAQFDPKSTQWPEPTNLPSLLLSYLCSPGELRVYDSAGCVTGLINGETMEEIPNSVCFNNTVIIFPANDSYITEVVGIEEGSYGLVTASLPKEEGSAFIAVDIPISTNATHQFKIDWVALSSNEAGVVIKEDFDADGIFERVFASDDELDREEYTLASIRFNAFWENITYPVFVSTNSTVSNFAFNQNWATVSFNIKGTTGSRGYCNISIPMTLLKGEPWTVTLNGTNWSFTATQNGTHNFIYFNYTHASTYEVVIKGTWVVPEFPSIPTLTIIMLITLTAVILLKTKRKHKLSQFF